MVAVVGETVEVVVDSVVVELLESVTEVVDKEEAASGVEPRVVATCLQ